MTSSSGSPSLSVSTALHDKNDEASKVVNKAADEEAKESIDEELGKEMEKKNRPNSPQCSLPSHASSSTAEDSLMDPGLHMQTKEEIMEERARRHTYDKRCGCFMFVVGLVAVIVAIAMTVSTQVSDKSQKSNKVDDFGGANKPLKFYLPHITREALEDATTPQSEAYHWVEETSARNQFTVESKIQRFALAALYFSTSGENLLTQGKFLDPNTHECHWIPGNIECNDLDQITKVDLSRMQLSGSIPAEMFLLLKHLKVLNLSKNNLTGVLPKQILELTDLEELDLHSNPRLKGHVSPYGLNLKRLRDNLKVLNIHDTALSGTIPESFCGRLDVLEITCNAEVLCGCDCPCDDHSGENQQDTNLEDQINEIREEMLALLPEYTQEALSDPNSYASAALNWLLKDPNVLTYKSNRWLQRFAMATLYFAMQKYDDKTKENEWLSYEHHECDFAGVTDCDLVGIKKDQVIAGIDLSQNNLQGQIPPDIAVLSSLRELNLSHNDLTGSIPSVIGYLTNLTSMDLSWNHLVKYIPSSIGQLTHLETIRLNDNRLHSHIPNQVGYLRQLQSLYLHDNEMITGRLPKVLTALPFLTTLTVNATFVSGRIPSALCDLEQFDFTCSPFLCGCKGCVCDA